MRSYFPLVRNLCCCCCCCCWVGHLTPHAPHESAINVCFTDASGPILGPVVSPWSPSWGHLVLFWIHFGSTWPRLFDPILDPFGPLHRPILIERRSTEVVPPTPRGPYGPHMGPFWAHSSSILDAYWSYFGCILGPHWVHVGANVGPCLE